jgi:hypothetical protein
MSDGKEYEVKGIINLFGLVFETNEISELYEKAFRAVRSSKRIDYDYISQLPFVFSETKNGYVVFSVNRKKISIAKPISEVNDDFDVIEVDEETFNDIF